METGKIINFNAEAIKAKILESAVEEQSKRLVEYAKKEIIKIGDRINTYSSANHMDRTGNLLNSLVWGVCYNGKLVERGFYRNADSTEESYNHEWFDADTRSMFPVDGHEMARKFSSEYARRSGKGWKIFFAILAPYWGDWERGFTMRTGGGESNIPVRTRFMQFKVMSHAYDDIRMELKPMQIHISVYRNMYEYRSRKYKNKHFVNVNTLAQRASDNPYFEKKWFSRIPRNRRRRRWK
jgi:hypothetical protein